MSRPVSTLLVIFLSVTHLSQHKAIFVPPRNSVPVSHDQKPTEYGMLPTTNSPMTEAVLNWIADSLGNKKLVQIPPLTRGGDPDFIGGTMPSEHTTIGGAMSSEHAHHGTTHSENATSGGAMQSKHAGDHGTTPSENGTSGGAMQSKHAGDHGTMHSENASSGPMQSGNASNGMGPNVGTTGGGDVGARADQECRGTPPPRSVGTPPPIRG